VKRVRGVQRGVGGGGCGVETVYLRKRGEREGREGEKEESYQTRHMKKLI
jgi:hypothetical protein